ncbi:hypothetical protein [Legionella qingyii]|uniref:hypothetical protein n=1 Tax=Legionella qingyii TaxID=2184757 RepID=UPI0013153B5D|nr:hypothetical protein [Legionella qingyii]
MLSKFHKYVESSNTYSSEESLDELEQLLIEDQKKALTNVKLIQQNVLTIGFSMDKK